MPYVHDTQLVYINRLIKAYTCNGLYEKIHRVCVCLVYLKYPTEVFGKSNQI